MGRLHPLETVSFALETGLYLYFYEGKLTLGDVIAIPGVGDYNEAISVTQRARLNMLYLTGSWIVVGLLVLVF